MSDVVKDLLPDDYSKVITSTGVSVVDFWASWCGPCTALAPVYDDIALEYQTKANFYKLDAGEHTAFAKQLGIRTIPTLQFISNGTIVQTITGATTKDAVTAALLQALSLI